VKLLVTGGSGFIGSNFIRHMLAKYPTYAVVNLDKLTYAGNPANLKDVESDSRYTFVQGDICDKDVVGPLVQDVDVVVNFAAETHVDRSIGNPEDFIRTDVFGTYTLLEAAREYGVQKFIQISTDEVYGSVDSGGFKETDQLKPSSPYSSSKAAGDMLALSYHTTYGLPVVITRSSNNFGPYQYPEKLIPLFITNLIEGKKVPVYGSGLNVRDWIHVQDNCEGVDFVLHGGALGEVYNVGGGNERTNIEITKMILQESGKDEDSIEFVKDRLGHDKRYALDCTKLHALGWKPRFSFSDALRETIMWYKNNAGWWKPIKSGEYLNYYKDLYEKRHLMGAGKNG
jgi:dTDP-glucose 4,6-dehydratase